jgi:type III secretion system YscQ/HrcQ family protein
VARVTAFPWHELPVYSAQRDLARRKLSRAIRRQLDAEKASAVASDLLAGDLSLTLINSEVGAMPQECDVLVTDATGRSFLGLQIEPELASAALSRILNRPVRLQNPALPLEPSLRGALAALALEVARTASRSGTWAVQARVPETGPTQGLSLAAEVVLDGKRYRATLWFAAPDETTPRHETLSCHEYPAHLVLEAPLVIGRATMRADDLAQLECGDVWLSGNGWWVDHDLRGKGALCAPNAEQGVAVDVYDDRIVLGKDRVKMSSSNDTPDDALAQTLAELPIDVRVELGTLSLPAAEWAQLQPGDVIPFGPKNSPIRLRANGKVIAEGELVRVDDELGVRISSVVSSKAT